MNCPKCKQRLKLIKLKTGHIYGHTYSLSQMMSNKPICDYSIKARIEKKVRHE